MQLVTLNVYVVVKGRTRRFRQRRVTFINIGVLLINKILNYYSLLNATGQHTFSN
jgi:hypothetical protein